MNESRFWFFFTVIFDLYNLQKEGKLRSVANPKSPLWWDILKDQADYEPSLLRLTQTTQEDDMFTGLNIDAKSVEAYLCLECGNIYQRSWTLKSHMKKKHNLTLEEESFNCEVCNTIFFDKKHFRNHVKIHEKFFVCYQCKEVFLKKSELTRHAKSHFVCQDCGKVCESEFLLRRHLKSHKNNVIP